MNNANQMSLHISRHIYIVVRTLLLTALFMVFAGCSHQPDARLKRVATSVSHNPECALQELDSMDVRKLTDSDRHFHDFLTIKARDKAYINHESDSLILDVIKYYSARRSDPIYPEALYYGGRVYCDLGDYPTALKYYQQALDNPGDAPDTTDLKGRLSSQMGWLLQKLRLYKESIPYFTDMLSQKTEEKDTAGMVYAMQGLGSSYYDLGTLENDDSIQSQYLESADSILSRSLDYASSLPEYFGISSKILLSGVKQAKGDYTDALNLIRHAPEMADSIERNTALAYAADIYLQAGIQDTAYMYAHELIAGQNLSNKKTGYRIILLPEFRKMIHPDTLNRYYTDYKNILEAYFDDNTNEQSLIQASLYNYQLHERGSHRAREASEYKTRIIFGFSFLVIVLAFIILYLKYRNQKNIFKLREALDMLEILRQKINASSTQAAGSCETTEPSVPVTSMSELKLRKKLQQELMDLYKQTEGISTPQEILDSDVYAELVELLQTHKPIKDNAIWDRLERTVLTVAPDFISNLKLLAGNRLTSQELHTALLIKCGFRSSEMMTLVARSNGAVSSRRSFLGEKILDEKHKAHVIEGIIKLL